MQNDKSPACAHREAKRIKPRKPYAYENEIHGCPEPDACPSALARDFPLIKPTELPADIVLARLKHMRRRVLGTGPWQACCPAHADSSPSLSVAERSDGVLLIYCWAGCETVRVLAELGLTQRHLYPSLYALQFGRQARNCADGFRGIDDTEEPVEPTDDECAEWMRRHRQLGMPDFAINQLAVQLGLPHEPIWRLAVRYHEYLNCWVFPERDDRGRIVGLVRRFADGIKHATTGSRRGLTIPRFERSLPPGPLYIAEGASDTAAICSVGAFVIGRSTATVGALEQLWLTRLIRKHRRREVIVLGDRDEHGGGEYQAAKLSGQLANASRRTIGCALPYRGYKDVREQIVDGKWQKGLLKKKTRPTDEVPA